MRPRARVRHILLFALLTACADGESIFKIAVVIDAVNETDFEQSASLVKQVAEKIFQRVDDNDIQVDDSQKDEADYGTGMRITYDVLKALPEQTSQQSETSVRDQNPLRVTSKMACDIMNETVAVVLVHSPPDKSLASAISYALGFYQSVHSTFLRTIPAWHQQAEVWVALLEKLNYNNVILMYPEESNAAALVASFHELIDNRKIKVDTSIVYKTRWVQYERRYFDKMETSDCNVILIYASAEDAYDIFLEYTRRFASSNRTRVIIANELALEANNTPPGLLAVSLRVTHQHRMQPSLINGPKKTFLCESFWTLKEGVEKWFHWATRENHTTHSPPTCNFGATMSPTKNTFWTEELGPRLYNILLATHYLRRREKTLVAFRPDGDRRGAPYVIVNVQSQGWTASPFRRLVGSTVVGEYFYSEVDDSMVLTLNESAIMWGSKTKVKPKDFTLKTHLKVGTVPDPPFIYVQNVSESGTCESSDSGGLWMTCSRVDPNSGQMAIYCCRGLCIELLEHLAKTSSTPFTYEVHLSSDGQYGAKQLDTGRWTGLVGELGSKSIDVAVSALSINPERDKVIDFTKPWLYHGITILEKQRKRSSPMHSFMQPFQWQLWLCIFSSVLVIGVIMFALDKMSPFGRFYVRKPRADSPDDEYPLGFGGAMWFVWGVLLDSGIGERTPRSLSARFLGMVWCGFSMIMVASYTANLAAFLVLDQPQKSLAGINDMRLRNPNPNYTFATVKNSNVHMFFKSHVEYSTIYRTMEGRNYDSAGEAVRHVKNNKLNAFIWDSTYLEHAAAFDCELQTSGELFGKAAYGIGLAKESKWTSIVTQAILQAHESGFIQRLEAKYITGANSLTCKQDDTAPVRLGLTNMRDLFILVSGGIFLGFIFIGIEMLYQRRHASTIRKRQLALHYGRIWRERSSIRKSPHHSDPFLQYQAPLSGIPNSTVSWQHAPYSTEHSYSPAFRSSFIQKKEPFDQPESSIPVIWERLGLRISQLNPPDYDDVLEISEPTDLTEFRHNQAGHSQQFTQASPPSQDERMAYRPRRAIIV